MRIMEISQREDALAALIAAVAGHQSGGEVRARLQSDWPDGADRPTIVVRIANRVTVKQAPTYHEAAKAMLAWVARLPAAEPAART